MSTRPSRGVAAAAAAVLLLGPALGGCRDQDTADPAAPAGSTPAAAPVVAAAPPDPLIGTVIEAPDVVAAITRALDNRAKDVLAGDRSGYDSILAPRDPAFVADQDTYFANLRQLPLQTLSYAVDPATLVRDGLAYTVTVAVTLQLAGYDATPVVALDRYRFAPVAGGRRYRLASVDDAAWEQRNDVLGQPWDDGPIQVRTGAGVLGIFDARSVAAAEPLLRSVEAGIAAVSTLVPYEWSHTVVVYALSDDRYLRDLPDLPGGNPDEVDAVAVPVLANPVQGPDAVLAGDPVVAGTRLVLHPRMLDRAGPARDRLLRHELTHAAVGTHDDHAPVWLAEGLAEYVSVQPQAPADRSLARPALVAARAGWTDLPADAGFNGPDSLAHYALSWWSCEYVAAAAGQPALWTMLDRLDALGVAGGLDRAGEDDVLTELAGVNMRTLARKAGKLVLTTYRPPPPTPAPSPGIDPLTGLPSAVPAPSPTPSLAPAGAPTPA